MTPFVRGYARGETPNPCIRCNGGFRFAELLAFRRARRRGAARDRPLRAHRRARRQAAARARGRPAQGSELHARAARPAPPAPHLVPARRPDEVRDACARRRAPASRSRSAPRARRRASSPATTTASFLERQGLRAHGGSDRRRGRRHARLARRVLAVHARPAPRPRRRGGDAALRAAHRFPHEHRRRRAEGGARAHARLGARPPLRRGRRVTAKLRYRSPAVGAEVEPTATGFRLALDEPAYGVARGQAAVLYDGDVVVGSGLVTSARAD